MQNKSRELVLRVLSSIVLVTFFYASIKYSKFSYVVLIVFVGIFMVLEWYKITKHTIYTKYGFAILLAIACLLYLRYICSYQTVLLYFCSMWATDTFAMIGGKFFQGPKLVPKISPLKTWSGLLCGCIASGFICRLYASYFVLDTFPINLFYYGIVNGIISQASDIFISYFKRKLQIKDSGTLIPGHGGFLDRFDSIIFSAPFLVILLKTLI